jgi:hypothetical protein
VFDTCGEGDGWEDLGDCGCGGCESGGCESLEGDELGSVRFRIPLGITGYRQIAGFVWFEMETPQAAAPALFTVTGNDSVACVSNNPGGTLSEAVCAADGGRRVTLAPFSPNGVTLAVYAGHGDTVPSHIWEITNPSGTNTVRIVRKDGSGNIVRDALYGYAGYGDGENAWTREDGLTGAAESVLYWDPLDTGGYGHEERTVTDSGGARVLSLTGVERAAVGAGPAAATRETGRWEWDASAQSWRGTSMTWWEDSLNPLVNGQPKFRYGNDGSWEYRAFDARGREILRAEPLDGSGFPPFAADPAPFTLSNAAAYAPFDALVTETSYEPLPGDGNALNDSREPRETARYAVRGGTPDLISREWHVYTRGVSGGYPAVTRTTVRAASPSSAFADPANAVSMTVSVAEDDASVPVLLRGKPLLETGAGGATNSYAYAFGDYDPAARAFTEDPDGPCLRAISSPSSSPLRETTISAAAFGHVLLKESRHAQTAALLSWEASEYDARRRLLSTRYSDGTALTNTYDCCRLASTRSRDGTVTEYLRDPSRPNWSAEARVTLGGLPGLNGCYPVTETTVDLFGRVTNQTVSVWSNGVPCAAFPPSVTAIEYPYGLAEYSVTTGPDGTQIVSIVSHADGARVQETRASGTTNRVYEYYGGGTVAETFDTNGWHTVSRFTGYLANGLKTVTVTSWSSTNTSGTVTNSIAYYDFSGQRVSETGEPLLSPVWINETYALISNDWHSVLSYSVITNGETNVFRTVCRRISGLSPQQQSYVTIAGTNGVETVFCEAVDAAAGTRTTRQFNPVTSEAVTAVFLGGLPVLEFTSGGVSNIWTYLPDGSVSIQTNGVSGFSLMGAGQPPTPPSTDPNDPATWAQIVLSSGNERGWHYQAVWMPFEDKVAVVVSYTMSDADRKCCERVTVDRYVRKIGLWAGSHGPYTLDHGGEGGAGGFPTGYAESDAPEGTSFTFGLYRSPWTFSFLWKARCVKGRSAGKALSSLEKKYRVSGHWNNGSFSGWFD